MRHHRRHRLGDSRTVIPGGAPVNAGVMFGVAVLMLGGGVKFLLLALSSPIRSGGFIATAAAFGAFGIGMIVTGVIMLVRHRRGEARGGS